MYRQKKYCTGEQSIKLSLDAVSTAGVWLDDVTANWKMTGKSSSQITIGSINKPSEVVQMDDVTPN